jgi:hypothetical protein
MANRAYLLNTSVLTSDPYLLRTKLEEPGNDFADVAEAAYKIPIPWLCCFTKEDIRIVKVPPEIGEESGKIVEVGLPCTTITQALENLTRALPLFEDIAGNAKIGRAYWLNAISCLQALPLPYLTMNPLEVLFMEKPIDYARKIVAALSGDQNAIPFLKELSCYDDSAAPYPPDVLTVVPGPNHHPVRIGNAVALDCGGGFYWHLSKGSKEPDTPAIKPDLSRQELNLERIHDDVLTLAKSRLKSAHIFFGFMPITLSHGEQLKLLISTQTDGQRDALLNDRLFREQLDGRIRINLEAVCHEYGFSWLGFVFESHETLDRDFNGAYNSWIFRPVAHALSASPHPVEANKPRTGIDERMAFNISAETSGTPAQADVAFGTDAKAKEVNLASIRGPLTIIAGVLTIGMAMQVIFMIMAGISARHSMGNVELSVSESTRKAEEKLLIQDYFHKTGIRAKNKIEIDLLEADRRRSEEEDRRRANDRNEQDRKYQQFVDEGRQKANEVSSNLRLAEEYAQREAAYKRRQREEEERMKEEERTREEERKERMNQINQYRNTPSSTDE